MKWNSNSIEVDVTKKPKKITGTRFASLLGYNKWSTPFKTWCELTRTYEEPFEGTIYTEAGKIIEPKQAEYVKNAYFIEHFVTPEDVYGKDFFSKTFGDFFPDEKIFGGMWDYLEVDEDNKPIRVFEMKTTKRVEDWEDDVPEYYALQASLYAYLLGIDDVTMVCSFLEDKDYREPQAYVCSTDNTITVSFKVSERYKDFDMLIEKAEWIWNNNVLTGISVPYDESKDADIIKELRKNNYNPESDVLDIIEEANKLQTEIDEYLLAIKDKEKRLKNLKEQIKAACMEQFGEEDNAVAIQYGNYQWTLSKSVTKEVDKKKLEADGLINSYLVEKTTYRLTSKEI